MKPRLILGGLLLAASTTLFAQPNVAPGAKDGPLPGRHEPRSCEKAPDPAKCEARRKEMHAHMSQAREACKGREGPEKGQCMATQMCARAPDPAKCQARAKERAEHRHETREKRRAPVEKKS